MKTILVLTGGSETDEAVFDTALAAARPLGAHLEFLHIRVGLEEAAGFTPHIDFARGDALGEALDRLLQTETEIRSLAAARHFRRFCQDESIEIACAPSHSRGVSAIWCEEQDVAVERLTLRARHNDLFVLGRAPRAYGLPRDLIEQLLIGCGRPMLVAPPRARRSLTGTVLVCWKETSAAARALSTALPLLSKCKRVVIVGVEEAAEGSLGGLRELARGLAWHGISAEVNWMVPEARTIAEQLESVAADCDADLLVMGGYGHGRVREMVFGGCTRRFLDHAERPVFMMH